MCLCREREKISDRLGCGVRLQLRLRCGVRLVSGLRLGFGVRLGCGLSLFSTLATQESGNMIA